MITKEMGATTNDPFKDFTRWWLWWGWRHRLQEHVVNLLRQILVAVILSDVNHSILWHLAHLILCKYGVDAVVTRNIPYLRVSSLASDGVTHQVMHNLMSKQERILESGVINHPVRAVCDDYSVRPRCITCEVNTYPQSFK